MEISSFATMDSEGSYEEKYANNESNNYAMRITQNFSNDETFMERPMSPRSLGYTKKHQALLEYYNHYHQQNMRLRNRIYHVKKVINTLKNIKRVCMERIAMENCSLVLDTNLVIPDNEFGANLMDKVIGDVVGGSNITNPMPIKRRRIIEPKKDVKKEVKVRSSTTISQKRKLLELVNDIVEEVHEASRVISLNTTSNNVKTQETYLSTSKPQKDQNPEIIKNIYNSQATSYPSGIANFEGLSESDFSSDGMTDRFLRESSIDHLLPEKPDYECDRKQDNFATKKISDEQKIDILFSETEESSQHSDSTALLSVSNLEATKNDVLINFELKNTEANTLTKNLDYENEIP